MKTKTFKTVLSLFFLTLSFITKAQDCYNSGITITPYEDITLNETIKPTRENLLILMPYVMNEREVTLVLKEKNNSEINRLLKKIKLAKTFQNIGFAAIPEALVGGGLIGAAMASNKGAVDQKSIGIGLVALSGVCLSSSLFFKIIRTKNYKKAIAKYNQLYN
jgi:hypothetical protein